MKPAARSRKVAVAGGGPAGLQAALTAATRGLKVTLFEKEPKLGGQVAWWARATVGAEMSFMVGFLSEQLAASGARIELNHRAEPDDLAEFDDVIVATGAFPLRHGWSPLRPHRWDRDGVPGADLNHVLTVADVLEGQRLPAPGTDVVVYDTLGGRDALVVSDHLAEHGCRVKFVTTLPQPSPALLPTADWGRCHGRLRGKDVTFVVDHELLGISQGSVRLRDVYTGQAHEEEASAVVLVLGSQANDELFHTLKRRARPDQTVTMIGDCLAPRRVYDAIRDGEFAARAIQ